MTRYKLIYFPIRGVAEKIRQLFVVANQDFEDLRIPRGEWAKFRHSTPFLKVPVLEEDGKQLAQSGAITRHLGRKFGLAGKGAWEEAQVDSYASQWEDFLHEIHPYFLVKAKIRQGDLEKLKREVYLPAVKKHFPFFIRAIKSSGSGYVVSSGLTYVDLPIAEYTADLVKEEPKILEPYPELVGHKEKVHSQPELKKWLETRPPSEQLAAASPSFFKK